MASNKILLISPQHWGKMFVAKHHYAVELARLGNQVYFLNPPDFKKFPFVKCTDEERFPGLKIVQHGILIPATLRFKMRDLYDFFMKLHVKWLVRKLGRKFDIVWCFEPNLYTDLKWFNAKRIVYHPVDELFYQHQLVPGRHADLIVSVTWEILRQFERLPNRKLFINHGIAREFADSSGKNEWKKKDQVVIGYSGNLLRTDIDFETLKKCIQHFPNEKFVFWGNYILQESNLAGNYTEEIRDFISFLKESKNVELRGQVSVNELVDEYSSVDIFLICYNIQKDQSHGTNYHKVMEFLSTGKVIVSNNITTYKDTELIRMCSSRESNEEFLSLLAYTIQNLDVYNSADLQSKRRQFAETNTYKNHVLEIQRHLFTQ